MKAQIRPNLMVHDLRIFDRIYNENTNEEPRFDPIDEWVEEEPVRQVWLIVDGLPQDDRMLLSLIWVQGCSMQDTADVLYKSKSFVFRRYQDLLKKIKSQLLLKQRTVR